MAGFTPIPRPRRAAGTGGRDPVFRWQCRCQNPPVLLATYDADGRVNIKVRDRYWHVHGQVQTICPRCGAEHILDLRQTSGQPSALSRQESAAVDQPSPGKE